MNDNFTAENIRNISKKSDEYFSLKEEIIEKINIEALKGKKIFYFDQLSFVNLLPYSGNSIPKKIIKWLDEKGFKVHYSDYRNSYYVIW